MTSFSSGSVEIDGLSVMAVDALWDATANIPPERKLAAALMFAGCESLDDEGLYITDHSVNLVGIGGLPLASGMDTVGEVSERIVGYQQQTELMMGNSAAFSYLNSGDKELSQLYTKVAGLGHFSMGHTVGVNLVVAGVTQATELEVSLQRDLLHVSKVTNTRTTVQNNPPIVVTDQEDMELMAKMRELIAPHKSSKVSQPDDLEFKNGMYPINKATMFMLSGTLRNFQKFSEIEYDGGKEKELREVARRVREQLSQVWPAFFTNND